MEADREAVRLVPDSLNELKDRRGAWEGDRHVLPSDEEKLLALGEAGHRLVAEAQLLEGLDRGPELSLAAVDQDELRQLLPFLQQPAVAPADDLAHRGEVVRSTGHALHPELPVVGLLRKALLEDNHRRHHVRALDVRDVEALDAAGLDLEVEKVAEGPEDLLRLLPRVLPLELEGEPGIADHEVEKPELLAALRGADANPRAPARAQPGLEQLAVGHLRRDQHLAGDVAAVGVELLERRGEDGSPAR